MTVLTELATVSDDEVVAVRHRGGSGPGEPDRSIVEGDEPEVVELAGLRPDTAYEVGGVSVRTLPRPPGQLLCRFATVNDVHFGERECGVLEGFESGPVLSVGPEDEPYPETMNRAAAKEIASIGPDTVLAKGDLTTVGSQEEFDAFLACYGDAFGERLQYVRGNHDAMAGLDLATDAPKEVLLPGARLAVLDTVIPGKENGRIDQEQLEWLDELASRADVPVLVFGHHHPWNPSSRSRPERYFGVNPSDSEKLVEVMARRPTLVGYFAGHTHRNRVRRFAGTGDRPWVEVACTKDYPGSWAEYRIFEGGVLQVHRRITAPAALAWSERCRVLFDGLYPKYALGSLDERCFEVWAAGGR